MNDHNIIITMQYHCDRGIAQLALDSGGSTIGCAGRPPPQAITELD